MAEVRQPRAAELPPQLQWVIGEERVLLADHHEIGAAHLAHDRLPHQLATGTKVGGADLFGPGDDRRIQFGTFAGPGRAVQEPISDAASRQPRSHGFMKRHPIVREGTGDEDHFGHRGRFHSRLYTLDAWVAASYRCDGVMLPWRAPAQQETESIVDEVAEADASGSFVCASRRRSRVSGHGPPVRTVPVREQPEHRSVDGATHPVRRIPGYAGQLVPEQRGINESTNASCERTSAQAPT